MAFQTIPGESGVDFIGTDAVDALFVLNENSGKIYVDAKAGGDNVDLTNETGVIGNAEVKLGEGNDTFTVGGNDTNNNRLKDSIVNGGPGNDNITTEGTIATKLRGNEGDDDFFLTSNYTNTTLNGNSGQDSFSIGTSAIALGGAITLSDSKILGGSGNDGQMDFSDGTILAVDSVIQGGKGLDTITIGNLTAGLSNFRVSGGADNDTINVDNTTNTADGAAYNGAGGQDSFLFGLTTGNTADASSKGGEGDDRYTISGSGAINAMGEAGDDFFLINAAATTRNIITGGAGADAYTQNSGTGMTFVINSVSESAATLTGTSAGFDSFNFSVDTSLASGGDIIDLSSGGTGEELVGNRLNANEVDFYNFFGFNVANYLPGDELFSNANTFDELTADLAGVLESSISNLGDNTGRISMQVLQVVGDGVSANAQIDGMYVILNNSNNILDAGDMMFQMAAATPALAANNGFGVNEVNEIMAAIEAGFN